MRASILRLAFLTLLCDCASLDVTNPQMPKGEHAVSTPVRWRIAPRCLEGATQGNWQTRQDLANACKDLRRPDFISIAISGGGSKASIFTGETLFYLQALGLLRDTAVMSSVSGGSFAAALYALSCEPDDKPCQAPRPNGRRRPVWQHDTITATLGQGNGAVVWDQVGRLLVPFARASVSAGRFADIIDTDYFQGGRGDGSPFRFADVNPKRPHLFLNSTITSDNRGGLGTVSSPNGCVSIEGRHYLRRRTPDEYFHFAFSDYYFGMLHSRLADYPLAAGVASSAAFPALVDYGVLTDYCGQRGVDDKVRLTDGGVNDNQGLVEVYLILAELVFDQRRSDVWMTNPNALEILGANNRAFLFLVNSSVTETTGDPSTGGGSEPHGALSLVSDLVDKTLTAIDVFTAEGYNLRKQSYLAQGMLLRDRGRAKIYASEISLTELDQYGLGGTEAALRSKAGLGDESRTDFAEYFARMRQKRQSRAYGELVVRADIRKALHLSGFSPQCYFDMRQVLDASLVRLEPEDQACLREAARWATALRAQELCDQNDAWTSRPAELACPDGTPVLKHPEVLMDADAPSMCAARIDALISKQEAERQQTNKQAAERQQPPASPPDPSALCQKL
jgi:hypothetical protein